jgi:hypothetical protein
MKKIVSSLVLGAMLVAGTAQAHLIDQGLFDYDGNSDPDTELQFIKDTFDDEPAGLQFLDRINLEGEIQSVNVTWDLTGSGLQLDYVLVKAGSEQVRIYTVSDDQKFVGGPDEVIFDGEKGISHISFFGSPGREVPDGGLTLGLLGLGLTFVEGLRRRINR